MGLSKSWIYDWGTMTVMVMIEGHPMEPTSLWSCFLHELHPSHVTAVTAAGVSHSDGTRLGLHLGSSQHFALFACVAGRHPCRKNLRTGADEIQCPPRLGNRELKPMVSAKPEAGGLPSSCFAERASELLDW